VGAIIRAVLTKEDLARTTDVLTQLWANSKIGKNRKQLVLRDLILEVVQWNV